MTKEFHAFTFSGIDTIEQVVLNLNYNRVVRVKTEKFFHPEVGDDAWNVQVLMSDGKSYRLFKNYTDKKEVAEIEMKRFEEFINSPMASTEGEKNEVN